ncbi:pilus assembly FimT family protein [Aliiroseovarius sp. CAU 1755]
MNLLEVLIALSIMGIVAAVAVSGRVGGQPGLELQRQVSELRSEAAEFRHRAVTKGESTSLVISDANCDASGGSVTLSFFADGTASGGQICVINEDQVTRLVLESLTGRLVTAAP